MPRSPLSPLDPQRPTVDEWGVYDPQQAGLAALFTRLADADRRVSESGADQDRHPEAVTRNVAPRTTR